MPSNNNRQSAVSSIRVQKTHAHLSHDMSTLVSSTLASRLPTQASVVVELVRPLLRRIVSRNKYKLEGCISKLPLTQRTRLPVVRDSHEYQ